MERKTPLKPKPLDPDEAARRGRITAMVRARDGGCLLRYLQDEKIVVGSRSVPVGECYGRDTPHHLRKSGQGGPWTLDNLVTLCVRHNDRVEDEPDLFHALGLVVRRGEFSADAWTRMRAHLLVDYHADGSVCEIGA